MQVSTFVGCEPGNVPGYIENDIFEEDSVVDQQLAKQQLTKDVSAALACLVNSQGSEVPLFAPTEVAANLRAWIAAGAGDEVLLDEGTQDWLRMWHAAVLAPKAAEMQAAAAEMQAAAEERAEADMQATAEERAEAEDAEWLPATQVSFW